MLSNIHLPNHSHWKMLHHRLSLLDQPVDCWHPLWVGRRIHCPA